MDDFTLTMIFAVIIPAGIIQTLLIWWPPKQ
jgi:hypothetical protein